MSNKNKPIPNLAARVWRDPVLWLAFGFGSGLARFAPGTFGTLPGIGLAVLLGLLAQAGGLPLPLIVLATLIVLIPIGIWLCGAASHRLGVHDHGGIVFDEIVGVLIPFLLVPITPLNLLLAFLWFRLSDIVKPWPIRWLDRHVAGGWGIMVDDLLAGVFALAAVWITVMLLPH